MQTARLPLGLPVTNVIGLKRLVTANPAANNEINYTLAKAVVLKAVSLQIVQGLTQTPQPILQITDGSDNEVFRSLGATAAMAASTTATFLWGAGLTISGLVGATPNIFAQAPLPADLALPAGYKIKTITVGKGANTDLAAAALFVVEMNI